MNHYRKFGPLVVLTLALALGLLSTARATVVAYPLPRGYAQADQFTLTADATPVPVVANGAIYDYAGFSFSGEVTLTITTREPIQGYNISPKSLQIPATVAGRTLRFTLRQSRYLIVKIAGLHELIIAADALETSVPSPAGRGVFNVTAPPFRADATGAALATVPIQAAIDAAGKVSGTVYVPAGVFRCGNLVLKSNVTLYLAGGAVLQASGDVADFKTTFHKTSVKMDGTWFIATEPGAKNIRIEGRGAIDGNGTFLRMTRHYLDNILVPLGCSDFTVDGITFRDSGLWGVIPTRSKNVTLRNTKHFNENDLNLEDDAVDIQESQNVQVTHSIAISEDDTYSTKTWDTGTDIAKNWPGSPQPLSHVTFDDCVAWSRCATYKVGFGNDQPQTDVTFRNSCSYRSMRAIAINHRWGTAPTQNIVADNIDVEGFWPRKGVGSRWLEIDDSDDAPFSGVTIENCNVRDVGKSDSTIKGHSVNGMVRDVTFRNNRIKGVLATSLKALNVKQTNAFVSGVTVQP